MARNCLRYWKKRSTKFRSAYRAKSQARLNSRFAFGGNHGSDLSDFEAADDAVGVVTLAGEKGLRLNLGAKLFGLGYVVNLPAGEIERQGIAKGVDDHVNLRRQPAARTPYGLVEPPFFLERRRCVGGLARWLRRSSRTDCRDRPPKS